MLVMSSNPIIRDDRIYHYQRRLKTDSNPKILVVNDDAVDIKFTYFIAICVWGQNSITKTPKLGTWNTALFSPAAQFGQGPRRYS